MFSTMNFPLLFGILNFFGKGANALIVPDELPSLLSVVYSNIPIIKKGTDSRLGWGFRLGDRADFQVLVELGPQTYTRPLANQQKTGNNKRNIENNVINVLYAQRQQSQVSNTDGGKWISQWSENMKNAKDGHELMAEPRPAIGIGEIDAKSVIPDDSALKLRELYSGENVTQVQEAKTSNMKITANDDVLDNVEIED